MLLKKSFFILIPLLIFLTPFPVLSKKPTSSKENEAFFNSLSASQKVTYFSSLILSGRESEAYEKINNFKSFWLDQKSKYRLEFMKGYLHLRFGKPEEAFKIFEALDGKYTEIEPILPYWTARAIRLKGDPKKAIQILEADCNGPCQIKTTVSNETVILKGKKSKRSVRKKIITKTVLTKSSYRLMREYASALCEGGEEAKAESIFNDLIQRDGESSTQELTRLDLVECKIQQKKVDEAYKELRYSFIQAKGRIPKQRFEEILKTLHSLKPTIPSQFLLEDRIARISTLRYLDRWVEASKEYQEILPQLNPSASMTLEIGNTFFKGRFYKEAAEQYELFLKKNSDAAEKKSMDERLATTYARSNQFNKAIEILKRIGSDKNPKTAYKIGFLLVDGGRFEEAIPELDNFIKNFPKSNQREEALWLKGWSLYRLKKFNAAAEEFSNLEKSYPRSPEARKANYWKKRSLEAIGQKENEIAPEKNGFRLFYDRWDQLAKQERRRTCPTIDLNVAKAKSNFQTAENLFSDFSPSEANLFRELLSIGLWEDFFERYQTSQKKSVADWKEDSNNLTSTVRFFASVEQIPPEFPFAVIREESRFNPLARSSAGAIGLMQIIPQTGYEIAESLHFDSYQGNDLANPLINIRFGIHYLATLEKRFDGNLIYTIASYNAGPEATERWLEQRRNHPCDEFIEEIPYSETQYYVKKVMQSYWNYQK